MHPYPHGGCFNMEPCMACEGKRVCHIPSDVENRCAVKTEPSLQADMWQPQNRHTHIKRNPNNPPPNCFRKTPQPARNPSRKLTLKQTP